MSLKVRNIVNLVNILICVSVIALPVCVTAQDSPFVNVTLSFSQDGGKTFETDFPILEKPEKLIMKAKWNVSGESREVKSGIITTILYNEKNDFASANKGFQGKSRGWKPDAYYQRLNKYWAKYHHGTFVYQLDLRERPKGTKGFKNKWNGKKYISSELPPCTPLKPGTYKFTVMLGYRLKKNNKHIYSKEDFFITIQKQNKRKNS